MGKFGRLGNQMFQYASLMGICSMNEKMFCCPYGGKDIDHCFMLGSCVNAKQTNVKWIDYSTVDKFNFDSRLFNLQMHDNLDFLGYFQTEKYFKHIENIIKKEFSFRPEIIDRAKKHYHEYKKDKPIVSLHVRRGDYLVVSESHPQMTREYWESAMSQFENCDFLIFSDDIQWCKENFQGDNFIFVETENEYIENFRGTGELKYVGHYVDLCLMTMCDSSIICNSSFSWWGAWLTEKEKVIAPKNWFGPSGPINWEDIYVPGWIKI